MNFDQKLKSYAVMIISWIQSLFKAPNKYSTTEKVQRERVVTLLDYYHGEQLANLSRVLNAQFSDPTSLRMQLTIRNVVSYITNRLCQTFKHGLVLTTSDEAKQEALDTMVDSSGFDSFIQRMEKYTFLCKTTFAKVSWRNDELQLDLITPEYVVIETDTVDPNKIISITYPKELTRINNTLKGTFCYWSDTEFKVLNESGVILPNEENAGNVNPYGVIPIVAFRERIPVDNSFIVWPGEELINAQDSINVGLTELKQLIKFQSFSVPVITNPSKDVYGNINVQIDPSRPLVITSDKDNPGSFEFVSPSAKITEVQESVNDEARSIITFFGLNPDDFLASKIKTSAESEQASNATIDEYRQNALMQYLPQIKKLVDVMITVYNTHMGTNYTSDDVTVSVQKSRVSYSSADEKIKVSDWRVANNLATYAQILVEESDDLSLEDAEEIIRENAIKNVELSGEPTRETEDTPTDDTEDAMEMEDNTEENVDENLTS